LLNLFPDGLLRIIAIIPLVCLPDSSCGDYILKAKCFVNKKISIWEMCLVSRKSLKGVRSMAIVATEDMTG